MKRIYILFLVICFSFFILGCADTKSGGENNNEEQEGNDFQNNETESEKDLEPVTITFMSDYPEDRLNEKWIDPLKEAFPHVTIDQVVVQSVNYEGVEEMVASRIYPDMAFFHNSEGIEIFEDFEMAFDLNDLVEQKGFDLGVINPSFLDAMYGYRDGKLLALPLTGMGWVTYYNKDIFDMMGVEYPEDDMTWSEILALARDLTQERGGIQYRGLDLGGEVWPLSQWSIGHTDPETDEPLFTKEMGYTKTFEMLEELFSIPGNYSGDPGQLSGFWIPFVSEQNIAMVVSNEDTKGVHWAEDFDDDSWDMVTWPQFDDNPGYIPGAGGNYMGINKMSEHKEIVFDLITYLVSEEHQMLLAGKGLVPVIDNPDVIENFGNEFGFDDKNIDAIFSLEHAPPAPARRENAEFNLPNLDGIIGKGIERLLEGEDDVQTILREMQEEAEAEIADAKGSM